MLYNVIYEYTGKDGNTKEQSILFYSKELMDDFIDWLKSRIGIVADKESNEHFASYKCTDNDSFRIIIDDDAECRNYTNNSVIYSVDIFTDSKFITRIGFFNDLNSAENIVNIVNRNLTKYTCKLYNNIVIRNKSDLDTYKLFLSSYGDIIANLFIFPSVKEV